MQTLTRKPKQLTLTLALAVMAIGALVAVAFMFGGAPAQATTTGTMSHDVEEDAGGALRPLATFPCPGETGSKYDTPAEVSSPGHYAIFDVYWDDNDKNLVTNPCPPEVEVERHEQTDIFGNIINITYSYTRVASDIQIDSTVIQIPGTGVEVRADNQDDYQKWPFLYPDGTSSDPGEPSVSKVWVPPACPHDPSVGLDPGVLCIGFSAESLVSTDWTDLDFEFESIREPGINPDDRGRVLVFNPGNGQTEARIIWDTHDPDKNEIDVDAGDDRHQPWLFTKPGRYVLAVHVKGHPDLANTTIDYIRQEKLATVTSLVRNFTFHVGALADLSVGVTGEPAGDGTLNPSNECVGSDGNCDGNLDPGEKVKITVTARNAGPDKGENTKVDVVLPDGLTYVSDNCAGGCYDPDPDSDPSTPAGTWTIGHLNTDPGHAVLTIHATVDAGTRGQDLTVTANIYATEHIGSSDLVELDTDLTNNTAEATVTPLAIPNDDPQVKSWRWVDEHATPGNPVNVYDNSVENAGDNVGDPIWFTDADNAGDLVFTLTDKETGLASPHFTFTVVELPERFPDTFRQRDRGVQIKLTEEADLLSDEWYELTLEVSDGLDGNGNPDPSIDDVTWVAIEIVPDPWERVALTVTPDNANPASPEDNVTFTAVLNNIPTDHGEVTYRWETRRRLSGQEFGDTWHHHSDDTGNTLEVLPQLSRELQVRVTATVNDEYGTQRTYGPAQSHTTWPK